ncbi:putative ABC transporter binding protein NosD [compost metagenome]
MRLKKPLFFFCMLAVATLPAAAHLIHVGKNQPVNRIKAALTLAKNGDTILVHPGQYKEGNILVNKSVTLLGKGMPVLDGEGKYEVLSISSDRVAIKGFRILNSAKSALNDPGGIKAYRVSHLLIEGNELINNYYAIYLQYSTHVVIRNNRIQAAQKVESQSGNGIHCWKGDSLQIIGNHIEGHRDGIYFEFVTGSVIWRNISRNNLRYGLHFMFSNDDAYIGNYFNNNGAGVAVMFSKRVNMMNNTFRENWGDAAYGILFKELSDCHLSGNTFEKNTTGIFFDGSNRMVVERNLFKANGWAMRIQANCMDNHITLNNFMGNTFDVTTNGTLTLNHFDKNYWDKYEGYDLNKDQIGDVPFRPLSLYALIIEQNPPAMLLFRSFMVGLLERSEKIIPTLTPENFIDRQPLIKPYL